MLEHKISQNIDVGVSERSLTKRAFSSTAIAHALLNPTVQWLPEHQSAWRLGGDVRGDSGHQPRQLLPKASSYFVDIPSLMSLPHVRRLGSG